MPVRRRANRRDGRDKHEADELGPLLQRDRQRGRRGAGLCRFAGQNGPAQGEPDLDRHRGRGLSQPGRGNGRFQGRVRG
ncbi:MAG: hypothetical protein VXY90_05440 [Pseudomonadota bacterium]|nr:hypothetical protein [Pseudomonadota bacterium]